MLPCQTEFEFNQPKNLMQHFSEPEDALHEMITVGRLTLDLYIFENVNGR